MKKILIALTLMFFLIASVSAFAGTAEQSTDNIDTNIRITCFLQDMTLLGMLEAILRPKELDYKITKEYVWISTKAKIEKLAHKKEDLDAIKELRNKMNSIKVPLAKYKNADLRDVVMFLIKQTGINFVIDEAIFSDKAAAPAIETKQAEGTYKKTTKPNQKTSAVSGLGFEILYYKINRSSYGTLRVVGEIKNNSGIAQGVEIQAIARDRSGKIVDSTTFYPASTRNIPVHSTWPINDSVTDRKDCATVTLKIIGTEKW